MKSVLAVGAATVLALGVSVVGTGPAAPASAQEAKPEAVKVVSPAAGLLMQVRDAANRPAQLKAIHALGSKHSPAEIRAAAKEMVYKAPKRPEVAEAKENWILGFRVPCPDGNARVTFASLPDEYDGSTPMAMLVILHGGVSGQPAGAARGMLDFMLEQLPDKAARKGVIMLSLAAEADKFGPDSMWWRPGGTANINAAVAFAQRAFNVDSDRVFVLGMSDGASGCYGLASRSPDAFAGFFPWVGNPLVPPSDGVSTWYENFSGQNIYAVAGGKDRLYPGEEMKKHIDAANAKGANIGFKLYEEAGHDMSYAETELALHLSDHMVKWRRNPIPESLDYSTDLTSLGRRAWLSVDGFEEWHGDPKLEPHEKMGKRAPYRAMLGVQIKQARPGDPPVVGVIIDSLVPGGLAESLALEADDEILEMDGKKIATMDDLREALGAKKAEDPVKVKVKRGDETIEVSGNFPKEPEYNDPKVAARVKATRKPGLIEVSAWNASAISVYTNPSMCDAKGELRIMVNGQLAFSGKPASDVAFMLSEYLRTGDRTMPFCGRIRLDVPAYVNMDE